MAITVHIYYTGAEGKVRAFAAEMLASGTVAAIRQKPGNLQYDYFFPMEDSKTVLLIDRWQDQAAIDEHHASPMMETIRLLREKYDLYMRVERYVTDEEGIPEKDRHFIR